MKSRKATALATVALGLVAVSGINVGTKAAHAQSAPQASSSASAIPVHRGVFSTGKMDTVTYTPSCPAYVFDMDAAAIQESTSRAFVEAEKRRFETIRDGWDAYEDCLTENGSRDINRLRDVLSDYLTSSSADDATKYNALTAAANANFERVAKLPAPKAPKKKTDAAAPAAVYAGESWTPPTGRFMGTLTVTGDTVSYVTSCPDALAGRSPDSFNTENTRDGFNARADELRQMPERIGQMRTCRQENVTQDYELLKTAVNDGVNKLFVPAKNDFERKYAAVRFQLNEQQKPGGLLAPPELPKPAAKKAPTPAAPKKKKK